MADGPAIRQRACALHGGQTLIRRSNWCAASAQPTPNADRADGLLQPIYVWTRAVPGGRQGGQGRRTDRGGPAAGGRRRAVHAGARGETNFIRLATPTTDDHRLPTVLAGVRFRLLRIDHQDHRRSQARRRPGRRPSAASSTTPACRSRSASECARRGDGARDRPQRRRRGGELGDRQAIAGSLVDGKASRRPSPR